MPLPLRPVGWEVPKSRTVPWQVHLWQGCSHKQERTVDWFEDGKVYSGHPLLGGLPSCLPTRPNLFLLDLLCRCETVRVKRRKKCSRGQISWGQEKLLGTHSRARTTWSGSKGHFMVGGLVQRAGSFGKTCPIWLLVRRWAKADLIRRRMAGLWKVLRHECAS